MAGKSKQNGDKGEEIVKKLFRNAGYWVHLIKRNNSGSQPLDLVAIRGFDVLDYSVTKTWFLDCKYVESGKRFSFDDIQPNQVESMAYIRKRVGRSANIGFAIIFKEVDDEAMHFLDYEYYLKCVEEGKKGINSDSFINQMKINKGRILSNEGEGTE